MVEKIVQNSVYKARPEYADKLMNVGDTEPPILLTANAMRIVKHRKKMEGVKYVWNNFYRLYDIHKTVLKEIGSQFI